MTKPLASLISLKQSSFQTNLHDAHCTRRMHFAFPYNGLKRILSRTFCTWLFCPHFWSTMASTEKKKVLEVICFLSSRTWCWSAKDGESIAARSINKVRLWMLAPRSAALGRSPTYACERSERERAVLSGDRCMWRALLLIARAVFYCWICAWRGLLSRSRWLSSLAHAATLRQLPTTTLVTVFSLARTIHEFRWINIVLTSHPISKSIFCEVDDIMITEQLIEVPTGSWIICGN